MSKLIYTSSFDTYKSKYTDWEQSTSQVYRSIAYTADGYIITHGKAMKTSVEGSTNPWGLDLSLVSQDLKVTVAGESKTVKLPVIGASNGTSTEATISEDGKIIINHINIGTAGTYGPSDNNSDTILIPEITTDEQGHISEVINRTATLNKVKRTSSSGTGALLFAAPTNGTGEVNYNSSINVNGGVLSASTFNENGISLSNKYTEIEHKILNSTLSVLGHVMLSNSIETANYLDGVAATPKAVYDSLEAAKAYSDKIISANDAMIFKGTLGTGGTASSLPIKGYLTGWTYRIITAGTYAGNKCEIGDLIIAIETSNGNETAITNSHWTVAQTNIDGAVVAESNLTNNQLIIGSNGAKGVKTLQNGTVGQVLKINSNGDLSWASDANSDTWRAIKVSGTELLGTNITSGAVNFITSSNSGLTISGTADTISIGSDFKKLKFFKGNDTEHLTTYDPTGELSIYYGSGLTASLNENKLTVSHSNVITNQTTPKLGSIKFDSNGHITEFTEVNSLKNPMALSFGVGTSLTSYDGSVATTFKIAVGACTGTGKEDFSLSASHSGGTVTITPNYTKKYRSVGYYASNVATTVTSAHTDDDFDQLKFKPGNANITLGWDSTAKAITLSTIDTNTWRKVTACKLGTTSADQMLGSSIGTDDLEFSSDFAWSGDTSASAKLHMVWTEVAADGSITYAV